MAFAMLQSPTDWQTFQTQFTTQLTLSGVSAGLGFQGTPVEYPCLADVFAVPGTIQCCFVYCADAARLLLVADAAKISEPVQAVAPAATHEEIPDRSEQQDDMNRHVSAMLLAIVELLVDTSIIKPDAFEQRLAAAQRLVDEIVTAKKDKLQVDQALSESAEMLLKRLGFTVEDT